MARGTQPALVCGAEYPHTRHSHWSAGRMWACRGVRITDGMRAQPAATRALVLRYLRDLAGIMGDLVGTWRVSGTAWAGDGTTVSRPRRLEEYPENREESWSFLARQLTQTAADLTRLAGYARLRAAEVQARENARAQQHQELDP